MLSTQRGHSAVKIVQLHRAGMQIGTRAVQHQKQPGATSVLPESRWAYFWRYHNSSTTSSPLMVASARMMSKLVSLLINTTLASPRMKCAPPG